MAPLQVPDFGRYGAPAYASHADEASAEEDGPEDEDGGDEGSSEDDDNPEADDHNPEADDHNPEADDHYPGQEEGFDVSDDEDDRNAMLIIQQRPGPSKRRDVSNAEIDPALLPPPKKRVRRATKQTAESDPEDVDNDPIQVCLYLANTTFTPY